MIQGQIQPLMGIAHDVLAEDILAAYLYGSVVMRGLRPTSDLDVMIVSERPTSAAEKQELVLRLLEISMKPRPLELTIVVQGDVRPWRYPPRRDFQFGQWWRAEYEKRNFEPWPSETDPDLASLVDGVEGLLDDMDGDTRNVVLTLARIWSSLATKEMRSKDAAAD
jgi:predicted nucleotidyltransferase